MMVLVFDDFEKFNKPSVCLIMHTYPKAIFDSLLPGMHITLTYSVTNCTSACFDLLYFILMFMPQGAHKMGNEFHFEHKTITFLSSAPKIGHSLAETKPGTTVFRSGKTCRDPTMIL